MGQRDEGREASVSSPGLARWLLATLLRGEDGEFVVGDLEELFRLEMLPRMGVRRARRWYWRQAMGSVVSLRVVRPMGAARGLGPGMHGTGGTGMESFWNDVRYGFRALVRMPGFTLSAVLTLALGMGMNSAIFTLVNTVLLRPLPYPEPERIVFVWESRAGGRMSATAPDYMDIRSQTRSFEGLGARTAATMILTGGGDPERLRAARVSSNYGEVLGLRTIHGRNFLDEEDQAGSRRVVLLAHGFWQRRFGGDRRVVGREIRLNDESYTVVGVLQAHVRVADDVWIPLALTATELASTGSHRYTMVGRLRAGVTAAAAGVELRAIAARLERERAHSNTDVTLEVVPIREQIVGDQSLRLFILVGAVAFVLLIACANVANLLLARASGRHREIALRTALGAGRVRVMRQLLAESVLLAVAGGGLGLLLAFVSLDALVSILPPDVPRLNEVRMDMRVLTFTGGVAIAVGLLFGLAPAVRTSLHPGNALREDHRGTGARVRHRMRSTLVVLEVAFSVVLLVGAGLMLRSFARLSQVDPGFDGRGVLAVRVSLPPARYAEPAAIASFYERLLDRVVALPSVRAAAVVTNLPGSGSSMTISVRPEGRTFASPNEVPVAAYQAVSPAYFSALAIPLVRGRSFMPADRPGTARVAVINESMAAMIWPGENAIGKRFTLDDDDETPAEIIGVVADVRHSGLAEQMQPEFYLAVAQANASYWRWTAGTMSVLVRTPDEPLAGLQEVRAAIWSLDNALPVYDVNTLENVISQSVASTRVLMLLLGTFAALALVLASIGIYGVLAYIVGQRTAEIGIRMALGAKAAHVRAWVLGQSLRLTVAGILVGIPAALLLTRVLRSSLFEIPSTDPPTFSAAVLLLALVALIASYVPARRATRIEPVRAMRTE
jgi:putative ABC transport system permease protein